MDHHHHGKIWTIKFLTSSNLRSASSAMCLASFSCISWISIFSSSFIARFSITFIPLIGRDTVRVFRTENTKRFIWKCNFTRPLALVCGLLGLFQFLQCLRQPLLGSVQLLLDQLDPAVQSCYVTLRLIGANREDRGREELGYSSDKLFRLIFDPTPTMKQEVGGEERRADDELEKQNTRNFLQL